MQDMWFSASEIIYPKHQKNHITLYLEELAIAQSNALNWNDDDFEVSMLYPLL